MAAIKVNGKLLARLKEYGVTAVPTPPSFDNILVMRLPLKERTSKGGIILDATETHGEWKAEPVAEGILCGAGLQALDELRSHGILVGDHVEIGRFAGWEKEARLSGAENGRARILTMKVGDILRSFDLGERLNVGAMKLEWDDTREQHVIRSA
jgi:co-chaperonin GroES (HSP10)